jgi:FtsP/CotA-like multicopper oxidase with cupredoxin domain
MVVALVATVVASFWLRRPRPRALTIVCRNMAFVLPGGSTANPVLRVTAGETIALELRNEDAPGILHDFAIDPLGVTTELLQPGQVAHVTFKAPARPATLEYYCRPHALVMRGTFEVAPR